MTELSVIIPLAPDETAWQGLLDDMATLPDDTEILFVTARGVSLSHEEIAIPGKILRFLSAEPGRAAHMNAGAEAAKGDYLWFLHADSRFGKDALSSLLEAMQHYPESLLYFDLAFLSGSFLMKFNAWGVWLRSHLLKMPFGDQGFCIRNDIFRQLGGFPEELAYGEDHVFVWRARQNGVALQPVGTTLLTSARKYTRHGWLKTTLLHQYLWIKQAWPEWRTLRKKRAL